MGVALKAAARADRPEKYEGEVLLLLASERPPHVDYLPGWQTVVTGGLHTQYVKGHHRDFLNVTALRSVLDAIVTHHTSANQAQRDRDLSRHVPPSRASVKELVLPRAHT